MHTQIALHSVKEGKHSVPYGQGRSTLKGHVQCYSVNPGQERQHRVQFLMYCFASTSCDVQWFQIRSQCRYVTKRR